ncbi:MAG TPA: helix-turn-helix domain-containing protein [Pseudonocardiaceae bacterium]|nr:helix-turn-helix domain-containing protein [Pseudonocardiaceae bacterium]
MNAAVANQVTYLPTDGAPVAEVHDFLRAHEEAGRERPEPRYFLSGAEPGDRVELPVEICQMLRQVVRALQQGLAVTVAPQATTLTTQQAAELLGVSRPTVIKLLDGGLIPFERIGSHRKILLRDLLEYRSRRRADQYAALDATAIDPDGDEDLNVVLGRLRESRRAVAGRRRPSSDA